MASPNDIFNWYKRYRVLAADMTDFQGLLLNNPNAMMDGILSGAVVEGYEAATSGDMTISIQAGVAIGATGYLHVLNEVANIELEAPVSLPTRSLIVARPNLVNQDPMTNPTNPFETVYLRTLQDSVVTLIEGTPATSPVYPSTEANDVVLVGVRTYVGQTVITEADLDFTVRDAVGKNADLLQNVASFDDRLRPYAFSNQVLGIRPSQYGGGKNAKAFIGAINNRAAIFPKNPSGNFNYNDTFVNFQTGAVTGGDGATGSFTPTIPSAGNCIVATVLLTSASVLSITYGTTGTRAQCFDGIKNQSAAGAGSLSFPSAGQPIAFVIVSSSDGSTVTEIDFFDARGIEKETFLVNPMTTIGDIIGSTTDGSPIRIAHPGAANRLFKTTSTTAQGYAQLVNADVDNAAAIAGSKIDPAFTTNGGVTRTGADVAVWSLNPAANNNGYHRFQVAGVNQWLFGMGGTSGTNSLYFFDAVNSKFVGDVGFNLNGWTLGVTDAGFTGNKIAGRNSGAAVGAGYVGEQISDYSSSPNFGSTDFANAGTALASTSNNTRYLVYKSAAVADAVFVLLTPGNWDVRGGFTFTDSANPITIQLIQFGLYNTTSAAGFTSIGSNRASFRALSTPSTNGTEVTQYLSYPLNITGSAQRVFLYFFHQGTPSANWSIGEAWITAVRLP